eukprot:TRINITY_DN2142_c4_g1_i1.p1 TRINITY_DN2142_c4_g1~~TRINITY_DN2142_c4_g1_i1.p1  ORF type:complete len:475 (+),score=119.25 TRINITY_DN2142_c4_g1_i1:85-1509(+)
MPRYSPLWIGAALLVAAAAVHLLGGIQLLRALQRRMRHRTAPGKRPRPAHRGSPAGRSDSSAPRDARRDAAPAPRAPPPTAKPQHGDDARGDAVPAPREGAGRPEHGRPEHGSTGRQGGEEPPVPPKKPRTPKTYPFVKWTPPPTEEDEPAWSPAASKPAAFVTFIGNDKYADGALVLGGSVKRHSPCVKEGKCRTCAMLAPQVSAATARRLAASVMDDVVRVSAAQSLSKKITGTTWGSTFDKFYLYNLTQYAAIAFFDADIVMQGSPDDIFTVRLSPDLHWLAATVGHSSKGYFHTGCMVLRPSLEVLDELLTFYRTSLKNKTDKYGFRGVNARDGLVMRYFIAGRVVPLGLKYSAQHGHASKGVVGIHLSGTWKPWFNRWGNRSEVSSVREALRSPETFGAGHRKWWIEYEHLHRKYLCREGDAEEAGAWAQRWGSNVSCKSHVWMLRHTQWEYVQPLGGYSAHPRAPSQP